MALEIDQAKNEIATWALKIAEYEASGVKDLVKRKGLDIGLNGAIIFYNVVKHRVESEDFMEKFRCQSVPTPELNENIINLNLSIPI